jgi:hypothetical protein
MTVNAQDFLESIQRAAGQKPKKKTHKMLTAAPDLSVFWYPGREIQSDWDSQGRCAFSFAGCQSSKRRCLA